MKMPLSESNKGDAARETGASLILVISKPTFDFELE